MEPTTLKHGRSTLAKFGWRALFVGTVAGFLSGGCMEMSPFETDLDDDERGQTAANLARLSQSAPAADGPFRVALISDTHEDYDGFVDLIDVLNGRGDIAFVLHVGDMTDSGLRQEYRWTLECLKRLHMPFFTAIGNHDTLSNGTRVYRTMFGAFNYSFEYAGARFVMVNSNRLDTPRELPSAAWLDEHTAPSADVDAVFIASHQPLFGPDVIAVPGLEEVIRDNNVTATLSGHFHYFKFSVLDGLPVVEVGTTQVDQWILLTIDGSDFSVAQCVFDQCTPRTP